MSLPQFNLLELLTCLNLFVHVCSFMALIYSRMLLVCSCLPFVCFPMPLTCSRMLLFLSRMFLFVLLLAFACSLIFQVCTLSMYTLPYKSCYWNKDPLNTKNKLKFGASFFKQSSIELASTAKLDIWLDKSELNRN